MSVWEVANGKFRFSYLQAGTVNHKLLSFNETHKEQTILSLFNREKLLVGANGAILE